MFAAKGAFSSFRMAPPSTRIMVPGSAEMTSSEGGAIRAKRALWAGNQAHKGEVLAAAEITLPCNGLVEFELGGDAGLQSLNALGHGLGVYSLGLP